MMKARFFIRNDDVTTLDKRFRFFFDIAKDHNIPVVYAVIPGKMDKGIVRFLCRAKEKTPQLLDIVQHGWLHTNYAAHGERKYEFGRARSLKHQREDIKQGHKKMRLAFGENFTPAFVPPYHGYDQRTLRIIDEEGFQIFSAGSRRFQEKRKFIELPALISFSRYEPDKKSVHCAKDVIVSLAQNIHRHPVTGILTHHEDFRTKVFRQELIRFLSLIDTVRAKEGWRILLYSDLLRKE